MTDKEITFEKLPQAVSYLIEKVESLTDLLENQKAAPQKRLPIEIDAACKLIYKAKPTIYSLVSKGLIPCYKNGKKLYFYEDELLNWVAQGKRKTQFELRAEIEAEMAACSPKRNSSGTYTRRGL